MRFKVALGAGPVPIPRGAKQVNAESEVHMAAGPHKIQPRRIRSTHALRLARRDRSRPCKRKSDSQQGVPNRKSALVLGEYSLRA